MKCKTAWGHEYLVEKLNRSFCNNDYKKHRKAVLLDKELGKMPETMNAANRQKEINRLREEHAENQKRVNEITDLLKFYKKKSHNLHVQIYQLESGVTAIKKKKFIMPCSVPNCRGFLSSAYKCEICEIYTCPDCLVPIGDNRNNDLHECEKEQLENAKFIKETCKACPGMCGEFIYKIDGCDQMWCTTCHTTFSWKTGEIENGVIHNPHYYQAMQNGIAAAVPRAPGDIVCGGLPDIYTMIITPYKRYMRKFMISNTSYLENSSFRTAIDVWSSIEQLRGIPDQGDDYIMKMEDFSKNADIYNSGHTATTSHILTTRDMKIMAKYVYYYIQIELLYRELNSLHRLCAHINELNLPQVRMKIAELQNHEKTRVDYLLSNITKEKLADEVYRLDLIRQKLQEEIYVFELFSACSVDFFRSVVISLELIQGWYNTDFLHIDDEGNTIFDRTANEIDGIIKRLTEFKKLCNYCTREFVKIGCVFNKVSNYIEMYSIKTLIDTRDSRLLVLRNLRITIDAVNVKIPRIVSVMNCYKWLMYNKIIIPDSTLNENDPDGQIMHEHFCYDTFNLTTKKLKNISEFKSYDCRKQHTVLVD
tara:strand:- start:420 stop:2195 length:1776 start_codon:yes stop_codon:yes gene_type:complete